MTTLVVASFVLWLIDPRGPYWIFGAASICMAWGISIERKWVQYSKRTVPLPGLPPPLDGFRIVHLSDIHWDRYTRPERLHAIFERVNGMRPDLIVLTGDLVTHYRRYIEPCADGVGRLRARLGVRAVMGNHDHWANGRLVRSALERQGIRVMFNEHELLDGGLWLIGVDDPHLQFADLDKALDGVPDDGLPRLLLAHSPDIMRDAVGRVDAVLTGHTHGGQVRFPVVGPLLRATRHEAGKRHVMGVRRIDRTLCFTNRGLGTVLIPIRFNCRPEIAVITLRSAPP